MELKKEYKGVTMSNGRIKFDTDNIKEEMIPYYIANGFGYIFKDESKKKSKNDKTAEENKEEKED